MKVSDLFTVEYGNSLSLNRLEQVPEGSGIAFVSRTAQNNGVVAWVAPLPELQPFAPGQLTVCLRSRNHALSTFLQVNPFYTAYHLFVLTPKQPMTIRERLWWALCIERNRYRYNFGRQANRSLAALELPDEPPSWLRDVPRPSIKAEALIPNRVALPPVDEWEAFRVADLFRVHRGRSVVRRDATPGKTPLVTASSRNNGISAFISAEPDHPAGRITVASNGSVGEAFVQPAPFVATADVSILEPLVTLDDPAKHFVCTVLRREKYRFNYGRKWPAGRLAESSIRLPAGRNGEPNLRLMNRFVRSLPLSAAIPSR